MIEKVASVTFFIALLLALKLSHFIIVYRYYLIVGWKKRLK